MIPLRAKAAMAPGPAAENPCEHKDTTADNGADAHPAGADQTQISLTSPHDDPW